MRYDLALRATSMQTDPHPDCLGEPILLAYVQGELSAEEARRAEQHLDACGDCLAVVAVLGGSRAKASTAGEDASTRYEIGAQIARGGMGRILAAWDRTLDRAVVLKTVSAGDALSRERFAREMIVTARLQHPAIVPVYDGGHLADGTPFYVMRRVDGRELEACIVEASTLLRRLELLRPYIALVDAVAYAHAEHFVHRDLKPRNVLVGPFGETVVLDWGLAKHIDDKAVHEPDTLAPEADDPGLTSTGAVMGTPGYIAAEIARGRPATPRSDVFSLGVILARILTGQPPQRAAELADDAVAGAPADLVAIARRATDPDADRRYADAGELADDLRRFEAGRLVAARSYGVLDRVVRFVRRHRAAVSVGAVATLGLLGLGGWSYRNVSAARTEAELALQDAEAHRSTAEREREAAEEIIDFALEDLSAQLQRAGRMDLLGGLIGEVDEYYERHGRPGDPRWALRRARALALAAETTDVAGSTDAALELRARTESLLREAARDPTLKPDADHLLCESLRGRAMLLRENADTDGAVRAAAECIEIAQSYAAEDHADPRWRRTVAACEIVEILVRMDRGDNATALTQLEALRDRAAAWKDDDDGHISALRRLVHGRLGVLAMLEQRVDDAIAHFESALGASLRLRQLRPGNLQALTAVAGDRMDLGGALRTAKRLDEAAQQLELAIATYEVLQEVSVDHARIARNLSMARRDLTALQLARGHTQAAIATARDNVAAMRELADRLPGSSPVRLDLGFVLIHLADALARGGQPDDAPVPFEEGLRQLEQVVTESPDDTMAQRKLAYARLLHGDFELERGNLATAAASLRRARDLRSLELQRSPSAGAGLGVAEPSARLALIHWRRGEAEAARALLVELRDAIANAEAQGVAGALAEDLRRRVEEPARELGVHL